MSTPEHDDVTRILRAAAEGVDGAADELLPRVYDALRGIARVRMAGERADHTLSATALVHEAYLKLFGSRRPAWEDRAHFYRAAAQAMRRILVDHARGRARDKRGGGRGRVPIDVLDLAASGTPEEILALDEAVRRLDQQDAGCAEIVRLRFFAGLSVAETAEVLGKSERSVKREWAFARAWLVRALGDGS